MLFPGPRRTRLGWRKRVAEQGCHTSRDSAALAAAVALPASAETYKLAITDVEGLERLQTDWGPFKAALEAASGESFEFFPVASRTAAAEALRALDRLRAAPEEGAPKETAKSG